jgi:cytochrome c
MNAKIPALAAILAIAGAVSAARAADNGEQLFRRYCFICHATEPGVTKLGPSLAGIIGREAGAEAGFGYSDAMQSAHIKWDEKMLDKYLADPRAVVPGTKMLFQGVKNDKERHAIIEYLESLKS